MVVALFPKSGSLRMPIVMVRAYVWNRDEEAA